MATSLVPQHARWAFQAGSASLAQFQFVQVNSSSQLVTPSATGVFAYVLDDAPSVTTSTFSTSTEGYSGGYIVGGPYYTVVTPAGVFQKVITGATLSANTAVMTDASGHAVAAVSGAFVLGWTIAASSSGDVATIFLNTGGHY